MLLYGGFAGFGITAGVHRLWSHRAYKAKLPLKILLLMCYSAAGMVGKFHTDLCNICFQTTLNEFLSITQNSLWDWVRDHRVHHKFSETDADPHNSNRGFFFAHVGWLMQKKHPDVTRKGNSLDFKDILEDPLLQFYNRQR